MQARISFLTDEHKAMPNGIAAGGARRDRTDDLLLAKQALSQLSYGPSQRSKATSAQRCAGMVGLGRFELPTSRLSSARSNQLSYRPNHESRALDAPPKSRSRAQVHQRRFCSVGSSEKKEKRRRRSPAKRPDRYEPIGPMCS
jgi:hypothetical protein